jgi:hypothetical protein
VFLADSGAERDGWLAALTEKVEAAKGQKETVHASEGYKAALEKLAAPGLVAASVIKDPLPKKSSEAKSFEKERSARSDKTGDASKKSRSQSRGKAILATLRGKKEEVKETTETPAEEAKEAPVEAKEEPATSEPSAAAATEPGMLSSCR